RKIADVDLAVAGVGHEPAVAAEYGIIAASGAGRAGAKQKRSVRLQVTEKEIGAGRPIRHQVGCNTLEGDIAAVWTDDRAIRVVVARDIDAVAQADGL